jgi:hypothetical protein
VAGPLEAANHELPGGGIIVDDQNPHRGPADILPERLQTFHGEPEGPAGSRNAPERSLNEDPGRYCAQFGEEIVIEQGLEIRRPSTLHARASGTSAHIESVEEGGSAVVVAEGHFKLP